VHVQTGRIGRPACAIRDATSVISPVDGVGVVDRQQTGFRADVQHGHAQTEHVPGPVKRPQQLERRVSLRNRTGHLGGLPGEHWRVPERERFYFRQNCRWVDQQKNNEKHKQQKIISSCVIGDG